MNYFQKFLNYLARYNLSKEEKMLDLSSIPFHNSPNKSKRKEPITHIVLHHTGPGSFSSIVKWLCNKDAKASAHYVAGVGGELANLVLPDDVAWHAGVSSVKIGQDIKNNVNNFSVGIEICNIGLLYKQNNDFYYEIGRNTVKWKGAEPTMGKIVYPDGKELSGFFAPYPIIQIQSVVDLCKSLVKKYPLIQKDNILTHYNIAQPAGRKNDPFGLDIENIKNRIFNR